MKKISKICIILSCILLGVNLSGCGTEKTNNKVEKENISSEKNKGDGWELAEEIVDTVNKNVPEFSDYTVDIEDFGGVYLNEPLGDNEQDKAKEAELARENTKALSKALKAVSEYKDEKSGLVGGSRIN